ncbi:hypothetical protein [Enterococcus sp. AZ072]|uniref:hypothetical protein n=1 Tax=unclassified Enterococcus TaxID=2608891 RepID=UPI003D2B626A
MFEKDLSTVQLVVNNHTLTYTNSFYYNWFKTLHGNLLQTTNFTNQFVLLEKNAPETYKKIEEQLLSTSIVAFLKQLEPTETFLLLTVAWSMGLANENQAKALKNYLISYTIQAEDLRGINQMNADLNQVLIQHIPYIQIKDLKMIYRMLEINFLSDTEQNQKLSKLNQPAKKRTKELLSLLEDISHIANGNKKLITDPTLIKRL